MMKLVFGDEREAEIFKSTYPQSYSNNFENTRGGHEDGQALSAYISTSSSEMQSKKTSKETDEVAVQSENIGKWLYRVVLDVSW